MDVTRQIEIVFPLRAPDPKLYDRAGRTLEITFTVKRTHASLDAAENFELLHERALPQSGDIKITSQSGAVVRYVPNGRLLQHELILQDGVTTYHAYHIIGGPITDTVPATADHWVTEDGDNVTDEHGNRVIL